MNRRDTIAALVALGAAGKSGVARAQRTPTLGILVPGTSLDAERLIVDVVRAELKVLGWIEGKNLVIESAFGDYITERLPALAEELVRKRVDVIWAFLPLAAIAAARATKTIPIVFVNVPWPIETGLIDSFARPGRNVTGVSSYTGIEVSTKRLEYLSQVAPTATRLSWILDPSMEPNLGGGRFDIRPHLDPAVRKLGYEVHYHYVAKAEDVDRAFTELLAWRAQALAVAGGPVVFAARERIAARALQHQLPSAAATAWLADAGGLFSYSAAGELTASIARSAEHVDRIFRGDRPANLPAYQPERYELVINLRTAKVLGLQFPQSVLLRADRRIE